MSNFEHVPTLPVETKYPYAPRAQFAGTIKWLCPRCGKINRTHLMHGVWSIRCKLATCRQRYPIGLRFLVPDSPHPGPKRLIAPPDSVIPDPFPECELCEWRSGKPANLLIEESGQSGTPKE